MSRGAFLPGRRGRAALAAAALAAVLSAPAAAAPWGSPLGRRAVRGSVTPAGDTDSFLVEGRADGRITVLVKPLRRSDLAPAVRLIGPSGQDLGAPFEPARGGLRLRRFPLPETGPYEIEVAGDAGSTGRYRVSARVTGRRNVRLRRATAEPGSEFTVPFGASGGARVSFRASSRDLVPAFRRIEDPFGTPVAIPEGAVRGSDRSVRGAGIVLPADAPFGVWRVVLAEPSRSLSGLRVNVNVRGPKRVVVRGERPDAEPALTSVSPPEAGAGTPLILAGTGFLSTTAHPLRVFVGGKEVPVVALTGGVQAQVAFPSGLAGDVDVALLNGDGNAAVLHDAVTAVPPPAITSVSSLRGSAAGGALLDVRGTGFRDGAVVTLAGTPFPQLTDFVDDGLLRFTTPPFPPGVQFLGVRDPSGQEALYSTGFEFVPIPRLDRVRPELVPRLADERVVLEGGDLHAGLTVTLDGAELADKSGLSATRLEVTLPQLDVGPHDVEVRDEFGAGGLLREAVSAFTFEDGPALPAADLLADDLAFADFDQDGDLDLFAVRNATGALAASSELRVFEYEAGTYTEVTALVMPAVGVDDFRGGALAVGDVAGDLGQLAPDGFPDLVVGTTDAQVLPSGRSRVRVLANRRNTDGSRRFDDVTGTLMALPSSVDDWKAEDLWVGDLDGDGGPDDIVATHQELLTFEQPVAPFAITHLSATRVFQYVPGLQRFEHDTPRLPSKTGTQQDCGLGECADDFTPYRGVSLSVADIDGDGRRDLAVVSPDAVTVNGVITASVQLARNELDQGQPRLRDRSADVPASLDTLAADIVLLGNVVGDPLLDLVVVSRAAAPGTSALRIVENRGFGTQWTLRVDGILPAPSGEERLQAHAAAVTDVDGDGDEDIVLLTDTAPGGGARGLRILRNRGAAGFTRDLEDLLPAPAGGEDYAGAALAVGDPDDGGGVTLVLARSATSGQGDQTRTVRRTTGD
jgi:hypothetical protein